MSQKEQYSKLTLLAQIANPFSALPALPVSQPASQPGVSGSRPPTFPQALKFSALEILENEEVDDAQRP
jgi:hypothetical protein